MPSTHNEDTTPPNKQTHFFRDASLFSRDLLLSCGTVLVSLMAACIWMWCSQKCHCTVVTCFFLTIIDALVYYLEGKVLTVFGTGILVLRHELALHHGQVFVF